IGIVAERTGVVHAIVICEGTVRLNVIQCETNADVISDVQAVELALGVIPEAEVVVVPILPHTALAESFFGAGYIERSFKHSDAVLQRTALSANWRSTHPHAAIFADWRSWRLWYGWNSH